MTLGIIFNSVSRFVEQVDQRQTWKYGELDQMTTTWNGPAAGALNFRPKVGTKHPSYPLMFATDSQITRTVAGVAEVQVTYVGIIQTNGAGFYVTPGIVSISPTQGSRDFQQAWYVQTGFQDPIDLGGGASVSYPKFSAGTQTTTVRYVGTQCSVKYQIYPKPSGLRYSGLGLGHVSWVVLSRTIGPQQTTITDGDAQAVSALLKSVPTIPPLFATNLGFQAQQQGKWWDCTEIYGPTF